MDTFDGKYQNLKIRMTHFAQALPVSEILTFEILDLEKEFKVREYNIRNAATQWLISIP